MRIQDVHDQDNLPVWKVNIRKFLQCLCKIPLGPTVHNLDMTSPFEGCMDHQQVGRPVAFMPVIIAGQGFKLSFLMSAAPFPRICRRRPPVPRYLYGPFRTAGRGFRTGQPDQSSLTLAIKNALLPVGLLPSVQGRIQTFHDTLPAHTLRGHNANPGNVTILETTIPVSFIGQQKNIGLPARFG